jgi:serine/threonine-protein kinase
MTLGGRYTLLRQIARGGMATVYLAEDSLLGRNVAVKVFGGDPDRGQQDEFLHEARAVARLSHPNIVEVYDAGVEGRLRYIVMQYVPGGTLRDVIRQHAPLDPRRAVILTLKIAEALDYGHTRGIVHCDVKPGNVLLGDQGEPKIADFGIAQSLTQAGGSDLIAGTAAYISPEQAQGGHIDGRSDVYSLAAVLYEMLCGRPPNDAASLADAAAKGTGGTPAPLQRHNPFVPPELDAIVMRGLAEEPAERYPTAGALADALRGYTGGSQSTETATRRSARPSEPGTERIGGRRVGEAPGRSATGGDRRRGWLFILLAGLLAATIVALGVLLLTVLTDGGTGGQVAVPQVGGERIDVAARTIQAAGLRVGDVELKTDAAPFGTVIRQSPSAATSLGSGETVNLEVSVGPTRR